MPRKSNNRDDKPEHPVKNKYVCIRCGGTGEEPEPDEYEAALKELAQLGQEYDK